MIDPNKKLNIILSIISILFILASIFMWNIVIRREDSRNYFRLESITDIKWIDNNDSEFSIKNDNVYLKLQGEEIVNSKLELFETDTGKIKTKKTDLYLRSASSSNLVIWYDNVEYKFIKYIEAK